MLFQNNLWAILSSVLCYLYSSYIYFSFCLVFGRCFELGLFSSFGLDFYSRSTWTNSALYTPFNNKGMRFLFMFHFFRSKQPQIHIFLFPFHSYCVVHYSLVSAEVNEKLYNQNVEVRMSPNSHPELCMFMYSGKLCSSNRL